MSRDYNGEEKRLQTGRRCCDFGFDMSEKTINDSIRYIKLFFLVVSFLLGAIASFSAYSTWVMNEDAKVAKAQAEDTKEIRLDMKTVLFELSKTRVDVNNLKKDFEHMDTRVSRVEKGFRSLKDDFGSHEIDDVSWKTK